MKIVILFFCLLASTTVIGQRVTYKDLIGTSWTYEKRIGFDSISYVFLDSSSYKLYYWKHGKNLYDGTVMDYSLDTSYTPTLWRFGGVGSFITLVNENELEAQGVVNYKLPKNKIAKRQNKYIYTMLKTSSKK